MQKEVCISSFSDPVTGRVGMVQSCSRRSLGSIRKHFFCKRVVKLWNRIPSEMVDSPSLSLLKKHVNNALNDML